MIRITTVNDDNQTTMTNDDNQTMTTRLPRLHTSANPSTSGCSLPGTTRRTYRREREREM